MYFGQSAKSEAQPHQGRLGRLTTYTYGFLDGNANDHFADLQSVGYSANDAQNTPGVTYTYDRRGRQATGARNGITTTLKGVGPGKRNY